MKNTGEMCVVTVPDANRKEGFRWVDLGNYYLTDKGEKVLITSLDLAQRYCSFVSCRIYVKGGSEYNG